MRTTPLAMARVGVLIVGMSMEVGCVAPALQAGPSNNSAVSVAYLFTHDGCRVYRFRDGSYHYFVRCDPPATSSGTFDTRSCGKNCVREESIPTTTAEKYPADSPPDRAPTSSHAAASPPGQR